MDGVDNGIDPTNGETNFQVSTTLSSRVKRLAVPWTEEWTVEVYLDILKNRLIRSWMASD